MLLGAWQDSPLVQAGSCHIRQPAHASEPPLTSQVETVGQHMVHQGRLAQRRHLLYTAVGMAGTGGHGGGREPEGCVCGPRLAASHTPAG